MKQLLSLFLAATLLFTGCGASSGFAARDSAPSSTPEAPTVPSQAPTPEPTPSPTPEPLITDAWYLERNDDLRSYIRLYGDPLLSDAAIEEKVQAIAIDPSKPMVALTFDDGPVLGVTDEILDLLEQYNARATFFVCGWRLKTDGAGALLQRMLSLGCEIGNHTYSHTNLKKAGRLGKIEACTRNADAIAAFIGDYPVTSLRPPGGSTGNTVRKMAKNQGLAIVLWSQSGNVSLTDPRKIADNIQRQSANGRLLRSGDIILLHDTKKHMVEAVALMLPELVEQGYQLVTARELLQLSDTGYRPGVQYRSQSDYFE